jgi:hypothetical protein
VLPRGPTPPTRGGKRQYGSGLENSEGVPRLQPTLSRLAWGASSTGVGAGHHGRPRAHDRVVPDAPRSPIVFADATWDRPEASWSDGPYDRIEVGGGVVHGSRRELSADRGRLVPPLKERRNDAAQCRRTGCE